MFLLTIFDLLVDVDGFLGFKLLEVGIGNLNTKSLFSIYIDRGKDMRIDLLFFTLVDKRFK